MKRDLLGMTKELYRSPISVKLTPTDLTDSTYWIFTAVGFSAINPLIEMSFDTMDKLVITINNQQIAQKDYVLQNTEDGVIVKFIKSNFSYGLDSIDDIQIHGALTP